MPFQLAAEAVLTVHLAFIAYVVLGGLLVARYARSVRLHIPVALWGVFVELTGWGCPLTALENSLLRRAGEAGYPGGFVERYLLPLIYPGNLTRDRQFALAGLVMLANALIYGWLWYRARRAGKRRA